MKITMSLHKTADFQEFDFLIRTIIFFEICAKSVFLLTQSTSISRPNNWIWSTDSSRLQYNGSGFFTKFR